MKLIVSADRMTVVNAEKVIQFFIFEDQSGASDEYEIYADEVLLSCHATKNGANKEFNRLLRVLSCPDSFLFQSEDSK